LLGLFGEKDANPSPADMRKLDAELTKHGKVHAFHAYAGANHTFMHAHGARYHAGRPGFLAEDAGVLRHLPEEGCRCGHMASS
jgi:carboxymethylenebutenolidase